MLEEEVLHTKKKKKIVDTLMEDKRINSDRGEVSEKLKYMASKTFTH